MNKKILFIAACIIAYSLNSCSKKTNPTESSAIETTKTTDSAVVKKTIVKPKPRLTTTPKVIMVTDEGAKKTVDGRLYYDLQGKRYWRNNKDGKYYLYNKSMHSDDAFKAPAKKT